MLTPHVRCVESWLWTITGPYIPPELQPSQGREDTLSKAKAAFRAKFDSWSSWAMEKADRCRGMVLKAPYEGHTVDVRIAHSLSGSKNDC